MVIGSRVKEERLKRNLSQQQLGEMLGVSKVSVCGYECGMRTPTMDTFLKLLDVLDSDPNYLLGRDVDVVCEEEGKYVKKISKIDLNIIKELKKHPKIYNKLCSELTRTVELMERKIN